MMNENLLTKLRRGYPHAPLNEQCYGQEFRTISNDIALSLMQQLQIKNSVSLIIPWRAGFAFLKSFQKTFPLYKNRLIHVDVYRDPATHKPVLSTFEANTDALKSNTFIIADPMLATGQSLDAIIDCLHNHAIDKKMYIASIIAAPEGLQFLRDKKIKNLSMVSHAVDDRLDENKYIVPGLGDFGDKFFAHLSAEEENYFMNSCEDPALAIQLKQRIERDRLKNVFEKLAPFRGML